MDRRKTVLVSSGLLAFVGMVSAQTSGGADVFAMLDGFVPMQISSGQDFLIQLLIPFMIIFASTRFVVAGAANRALGEESSSSRHSSGGMGGYMMKAGKSMSTWVAVATALTAVYMFGGVITIVTLVFVVLGLAWGILQTFYFTTSSAISGGKDLVSGSSNDSSEGVSPEKVKSMMDDKIGQLKSELEEINAEEQDEKQKEDQTEEEEEEGANPDRVEDEIEAEEKQLMDIVRKLETVERQLAEFEGEIENLEETEFRQLQGEDNDLHNIEDFEQRFDSQLSGIIQDAQRGNIDEEEMDDIKHIFGQEISYLQQLRQDLVDEHQLYEDTRMIIHGLALCQKEIVPLIEEDIHNAEALVEELEDEENKAEVLSQKYGAREIFEEIKEDESETANIETEIKNKVVERMQDIESRLNEEIEQAQQLRSYDQEELNTIIEIVQELDVEERKLAELRKRFGRSEPQFEDEITTIMNYIEEIESQARKLSSEHQA